MSLEPSIDKRTLFGNGLRWLCGVLVCVFSLNGLLRFIANQWPGTRTSSVLTTVASVPDSLYLSLPGGPYLLFELLLRWVVILFGVYLLILLISSVRYQSPVIFVSGMSGLFIGLFALTWLSILIFIVLLLLGLFRLIASLVSYVITAIISFFLWTPIFYTIVVLIGITIVAVIISVLKGISFRDLWEHFKEWLRNLSARPLVFLLALTALGALIWFVGIPLWEHYISPILLLIRNWLAEYAGPILSWAGSLLATLFLGAIVVVLTLLVLGVLGFQFVDQFRSARAGGGDTHQAFRAGFGMGASLGLVLLVCAATPAFRSLVVTSWSQTSPVLSSMDLGGAVYYFMPASIETPLHSALAKASLPVFDLACLLVTLIVANSSLITGMFSRVTVRPLRSLVALESLPPVGVALFGVLVAVAGSLGDENT